MPAREAQPPREPEPSTARELIERLGGPARERLAQELASLAPDDPYRRQLDAEVASAVHFREATLRRMEPERHAALLLRALWRMPERALWQALTALHDGPRAALHAEVRRELGLPRDDEAPAAQPTTAAAAPQAAQRLLAAHAPDAVRLCLGWLALWIPDEARAAAAELSRAVEERAPAAEPRAPQADEGEPRAAAELVAPGFSTLDRVLIRSVLASLHGVPGSLDRDELEDLVGEVVDLNDTRAASRFHRGFLDGLRGRPVAAPGPGDNPERRAWYLTGHASSGLRRDPAGALAWLDALASADRGALLAPNGPGTLVAPQFVDALLAADRRDELVVWLEAFAVSAAPELLGRLAAWAREQLIQGDPDFVARVLELLVRREGEIRRHHGEPPQRLLRDVRRRLAIAWRRLGRAEQAERAIRELLAGPLTETERSRLLGDLALLHLGVRSVESLDVPAPSQRESMLAAIEGQRGLLEQASAAGVPVASFVLALPCVITGDDAAGPLAAAIGHLRAAVDAMVGEERAFWSRTGLLDRARLFLSLLELRSCDPEAAPAALDRLVDVLRSESALPQDVVREALVCAALHESPVAAEAAQLALERWPQSMLLNADLLGMARQRARLREAIVACLDGERVRLRSGERWSVWEALLRASLAAPTRDLAHAELALDALEGLAHSESHAHSQRFVDLLGDPARYEPAWSSEEALHARADFFLRLGRLDDARASLIEIAHAALSDGGATAAEGLLDELRTLNADAAQLEPLRLRLKQVRGAEHAAPPAPANVSYAGRRVLFVGGNETQRQYRAELEALLRQRCPGLELRFHFTGWGSNWGKLADQIEGEMESCHAVVLMRFMRTLLGRRLRRRASEVGIPWVPCSAHGQAGLRTALLEAARLAARA